MSEIDNAITGYNIDDVLDSSDQPESNIDDNYEIDADDTYNDDEDNDFMSALDEFSVRDDDLVIVNNDGSYVVIPLILAELLMGDPSFIDKVDNGFNDIGEFQTYILPVIQKLQQIGG